jgi:hypothetical protein
LGIFNQQDETESNLMLTHDVTGGEFQNLDEVDIQDVLNSHVAELIEGILNS